MPVALSNEEWAYAAGIIDGEGCIDVAHKRNKRSMSPRVRVTNTNAEILLWMENHFGGTVTYRPSGRDTHSVTGEWAAPAGMIDEMLNGMLPYLTAKREQAQVLLALIECRPVGHYLSDEIHQQRLSYYQKLRQLKEASKNFGAYYAETRAAVAL